VRHFTCKRCGTLYEVGPMDRRKTGNCFKCGERFKLPMSRVRVAGISSVVVIVLLGVAAIAYFV
jgi:uncharacterized paraquat-inducible protein A